MSRTATLAGSVLVGLLLLTGCTPAAVEPVPSTSATASQEPADANADANGDAEPAPAAIPADCTDVVDDATYAASFGETPLNDPALQYPHGLGALTPSAPPAGATNDEIIAGAVELRCIWRYPEADVSFLMLEAGRVSADVARARLDQLATEGYTCADTHEGRQCQLITTGQQYPVEEADTQFVRDDVLVRIEQSNVPTSGLMAAVADRIWR